MLSLAVKTERNILRIWKSIAQITLKIPKVSGLTANKDGTRGKHDKGAKMQEQIPRLKLVARDLDSRRGKLFDFSKGVCVADMTPMAVASSSVKQTETTSTTRKTAGPEWFNMATPELTPEIERDLRMIRLRGYMRPDKFYKRDDFASKKLPEHFQIGTVVAGLGEKSLKKRERPTSITDEILANKKVKEYASKVFDQVQTKAKSGGKKAYKRLQNRRADRFHKKRLI